MIGLSVYGPNKEKIGVISEILLDKTGNAEAAYGWLSESASVEQSRDPTNRKNCKSGGCAMKAVGLTPRDLLRAARKGPRGEQPYQL